MTGGERIVITFGFGAVMGPLGLRFAHREAQGRG